MEPRQFLTIMEQAEKLKCNTRHSWTSTGRQESVAEHSWRLSFMAMLMRDEFPAADIDKVIRMCIIHDLGEAITGDIPAFEKTASDSKAEEENLARWLSAFPMPCREELAELYQEMGQQKTVEARLYKALDRLEAVMQHNMAELSTWLPLEYELQFSYGADQVGFSEYLKRLKAEIDRDTAEKIRAGREG